jgi:hypothetical protein
MENGEQLSLTTLNIILKKLVRYVLVFQWAEEGIPYQDRLL